MPGKRVQFDQATMQAIEAVMTREGLRFEQLADEAFKDVLKKHHQPVGLMASLRESVESRKGTKRKKSR
jgi:hypothetical protein